VVASFLVPYKRVDVIVRAFNAMPQRRLRIIGEGQQARELKAVAGPNIEFCRLSPARRLPRDDC